MQKKVEIKNGDIQQLKNQLELQCAGSNDSHYYSAENSSPWRLIYQALFYPLNM